MYDKNICMPDFNLKSILAHLHDQNIFFNFLTHENSLFGLFEEFRTQYSLYRQ